MMIEEVNPASQPLLSVVVPVYNEEECLSDVLLELREALDGAGIESWEAVIVDDGSKDATPRIAAELARKDPRFRMIRFDGNFGQTSAFDAGFHFALGRYVGMMDGDGQNDPHDFPRLLQALERQNTDMMCGVRQKRKDTRVRRLSSKIANGFRNWVTRETVTDVGCSIRVFRRACLEKIKLYEGMHRFFPTLFRIEGWRIGEIPVNHRPRTKGRSKYGIHNRLWCGLKDLYAVRWMQGRSIHYRLLKQSGSDQSGKEKASGS